MAAVAVDSREYVTHPRFRDLPAVGLSETVCSSASSSMGLDSVRLYNEQYGQRTVSKIQRARIGRGAVVVYTESLEQHSANGQHENSRKNLSRGNYNGYISPATAKKCKRMIEAWIHSVNCAASSQLRDKVSGEIYLTFATFTLPSEQVHEDNEIKRRILMPFIQSLQRDFEVKHYYWKAEPQENGRIHFHMLLDHYIDRELLSHWWDRACEQLGYVSRYMEQSGSLFPPAANVTQLPSSSKAISYVIKYLAKAPIRLRSIKPREDGGRDVRCSFYQPKVVGETEVLAEYRPISGRVWGCSDGVRACVAPTIALSERVEGLLEIVQEHRSFRYVHMDRAEVYIGPVLETLREYDKWLWNLWRWHHLALFRYLYMDREKPPSGHYYELGPALTELYR